MVHKIKIYPNHRREIITDGKDFEIRKNDRNYKVGDVVFLNEYDPEKQCLTGDFTVVKITKIYDISDCFKDTIAFKFVVMYLDNKGYNE